MRACKVRAPPGIAARHPAIPSSSGSTIRRRIPRSIATDREQPMKQGVLVVEDDPVSGLFFEGVLARAGLAVTLATCGAEAAAHAAHAPHVAWLVDAHLPDGAAADWLPRLRDAAAAQPPAHAVAHTASRSPGLHARLRAAGFHTVLVKPCTGAALLACIAD